MPHSTHVTQEFEERFPTPARFLDEIMETLSFEERREFVVDRVLARLDLEVIVGGSRAAGFPDDALTTRGIGDLDVGLTREANRLAGLPPGARTAAMDKLLNRLLWNPLGDHVALEAHRIESNGQGAFYQVTGRISGSKVAQVGLDLDSAPYVTAPVVRDASWHCGVRIPGLVSARSGRQNPADILAGKVFAIGQAAAGNDKPRYAKHLCDLRQALFYMEKIGVHPALAARSIAELARAADMPVAELRLPYLGSARKQYRNRRKKISPDLPDSDSLLGDELNEVRAGFQPILDAALRGDFSTRTSRALSTLEYQRLGRSSTSDGATQVATSHRRAGYSKRKAVADAAARTPPGRPPSRSSRTSHGR